MTRLNLSAPAAALLRALIIRAALPRDRVLLTQWDSVDWHSLTFVGERHTAILRLTGTDALCAAQRLSDGLPDAEFDLPGHIVADIAIAGMREDDDGSVVVGIEALTIAD